MVNIPGDIFFRNFQKPLDKSIKVWYNIYRKKIIHFQKKEVNKMTERVTISHHLRADRLDRVVYIATTIGYGNVVFERHSPNTPTVSCLTDTGVLIVKDEEGMIITMYIAEYKQANYVTHNNTPQWLSNVIKKNLQKRRHILQNEATF